MKINALDTTTGLIIPASKVFGSFGSYICPICKEHNGSDVRMIYVKRVNTRFFRYENRADVPPEILSYTDGTPESIEHFNTKLELARVLVKESKSVEVEKYIKTRNGFRIADVFQVTRDGLKVVHEIQYSPITQQELKARIDFYESAGCEVLFYFGPQNHNASFFDWMHNSGFNEIYTIHPSAAKEVYPKYKLGG